MAIDVKQAVQNAVRFVVELMESTQQKIADVRVEEIELGDDNIWHITLSYYRDGEGEQIAKAMGKEVPRLFRSIEVHNNDGEVLSMKIQKV